MLGDTAIQRAWMAYADANEVPHDHEDEEAFKQGFVAGRREVKVEMDMAFEHRWQEGYRAGLNAAKRLVREDRAAKVMGLEPNVVCTKCRTTKTVNLHTFGLRSFCETCETITTWEWIK